MVLKSQKVCNYHYQKIERIAYIYALVYSGLQQLHIRTHATYTRISVFTACLKWEEMLYIRCNNNKQIFIKKEKKDKHLKEHFVYWTVNYSSIISTSCRAFREEIDIEIQGPRVGIRCTRRFKILNLVPVKSALCRSAYFPPRAAQFEFFSFTGNSQISRTRARERVGITSRAGITNSRRARTDRAVRETTYAGRVRY